MNADVALYLMDRGKRQLPLLLKVTLFIPHMFLVSLLFQGPLVGVNPVQIRATVDLYPGSSFGGSTSQPENPAG